MKFLGKVLRSLIALGFTVAILAALVVVGVYVYIAPDLPSVDSLSEVQLQVPMRVYSRDGQLLAQFGETRREPLTLAEIPETLQQAFLASEDNRFYSHPGVDIQGLARAFVELARTGKKGSGGSTITMQVTRNFFLNNEKTYIRKIKEIFLSLRIERDLSKQQILELYLNKIYLGSRAYGVGAAAQAYYGKPIDQLTLAQYAMIAGLPKAPSRWNPIANPSRAKERRNYVLGRMRSLDYIDEDAYQQALAAPVTAQYHGTPIDLYAPYIAEMVRAEMQEKYPGQIYEAGFKVTTTIDVRLQRAADQALRDALLEYDRRHGYRGPEAHVELSALDDADKRQAALEDYPTIGGLRAALVTKVSAKQVEVLIRGGESTTIGWDGLSWARKFKTTDRRGPAPKKAADILQPGDIIRVQPREKGGLWLAEIPAVAGALVSLDPDNGAIRALSGGFDFDLSKFNRAIQAKRQPGSNFKPVLYSAALEQGMTPATLINDAPVVYHDAGLEGRWRPQNYSGKFFGPTRIRKALYKSRNLVSIRLMEQVGVNTVIDYAARFGYQREDMPRSLSLALGSLVAPPIDVARAYAVFANGGFRIDPHLIERIEDGYGQLIFEANAPIACRDCPDDSAGTDAGIGSSANPAPDSQDGGVRHAPRVVPADNIYQMTTILRDVIRVGTGRKAQQLGRNDLGGKTGTTNDQKDAWFSGFNDKVVTTAWVGFDQLKTLGKQETGGRAALPMWIKYMKVALDGVPETPLKRPPGIITMRISAKTGQPVSGDDPDAMTETFRARYAPGAARPRVSNPDGSYSPGAAAPVRRPAPAAPLDLF
jgi:penicillin-binding protein 1A